MNIYDVFKGKKYPITVKYHQKYTVFGKELLHEADDFGTPLCTSLYAPFDGFWKTVALSKKGYGQYVILESKDRQYQMLFAHLIKTNFKPGFTTIKKGDCFGYTGGKPGLPTSGLSTGPHVHIEVKHLGVRIDPLLLK